MAVRLLGSTATDWRLEAVTAAFFPERAAPARCPPCHPTALMLFKHPCLHYAQVPHQGVPREQPLGGAHLQRSHRHLHHGRAGHAAQRGRRRRPAAPRPLAVCGGGAERQLPGGSSVEKVVAGAGRWLAGRRMLTLQTINPSPALMRPSCLVPPSRPSYRRSQRPSLLMTGCLPASLVLPPSLA